MTRSLQQVRGVPELSEATRLELARLAQEARRALEAGDILSACRCLADA